MDKPKRYSDLLNLLTRGESLWSLAKLIGGSAVWGLLMAWLNQYWPAIANFLIYSSIGGAGFLTLLIAARAHSALFRSPTPLDPRLRRDAVKTEAPTASLDDALTQARDAAEERAKQLDAVVKKMAKDYVRLEEREAALQQQVAALEARLNPPPPPSDLTDYEQAVAFNELGKLLKKAETLIGEVLALCDSAADAMKAKHPGGVADDLNRFLTERLGPPSRDALRELRAELIDKSSAERAQDILARFMTHYNSARRWVVRMCEYGDVTPVALHGYSDWYEGDAAFWAAVDDIADTGPLRRLDDSMRRWQVPNQVPYPLPAPPPPPAVG